MRNSSSTPFVFVRVSSRHFSFWQTKKVEYYSPVLCVKLFSTCCSLSFQCVFDFLLDSKNKVLKTLCIMSQDSHKLSVSPNWFNFSTVCTAHQYLSINSVPHMLFGHNRKWIQKRKQSVKFVYFRLGVGIFFFTWIFVCFLDVTQHSQNYSFVECIYDCVCKI